MNTVRNPSSLRIAPTYFMDEWYSWANMKQTPTSFRSFLHRSGDCRMLTPSASRQSAAPLSEEAARFPCFATLMPAAAAIIAEVVEILNVRALSPPVPTISRTSIPSCATGVAWSLIATAHPVISSIVSALVLLVESAARNAAFCVGVVCPLMISFITVLASSKVRSPLFTILIMASLIIFYLLWLRPSGVNT